MAEKLSYKKDGKKRVAGFIIRVVEGKKGSRYQPDFGKVNGKRDRPTFKTAQEAEQECRDRREELEDRSKVATFLGQKEREEYVEAMAILKPYGKSLVEVARFFALQNQTIEDGNSIGEIRTAFLAECEARLNDPADKFRKRTFVGYRTILNAHLEAYKDWHVDQLTPQTITQILEDAGGGIHNRTGIRTKIGTMLRWAMKKGRMKIENPVCDLNALPSIRRTGKKIHYAPVSEVQKLCKICATTDPRLIPVLTIGYFAGIRIEEISKLDWKDINLKEKYIFIDEEVAKVSVARKVHLEDNLIEWLKPYEKKSGRVAFWNYDIMQDHLRDLYKVCRIKRLQNVARHSYATYHAKKHNNVGWLIDNMGHEDIKMLKRHYMNGRADADSANEFFDIRPIKESIIKLQKSA
jgi:integrase